MPLVVALGTVAITREASSIGDLITQRTPPYLPDTNHYKLGHLYWLYKTRCKYVPVSGTTDALFEIMQLAQWPTYKHGGVFWVIRFGDVCGVEPMFGTLPWLLASRVTEQRRRAKQTPCDGAQARDPVFAANLRTA